MRISKTVRNYIEKQVEEKVREKYAPALKREQDAIDFATNTHRDMVEAVGKLMMDMADKAVSENPTIQLRAVGRDTFMRSLHYNLSYLVEVKPEYRPKATKEMAEEVNGIIENIIVTLELGGTKADLERMLAEIMVEA